MKDFPPPQIKDLCHLAILHKATSRAAVIAVLLVLDHVQVDVGIFGD